MKLISCSSNPKLAKDISDYLKTPLSDVNIRRFADQEIFIEILDSVRDEDVFVIQSTSYPANDHLMEVLIMLDALKRAAAGRITVVMPYFGYARQDRKTTPRSPISAKLVADLITTAGANRVLSLDLHSGSIQGFFNIPVDNLYTAVPIFLPYIKAHKDLKNLVVVSPDVGGVVRARHLSKHLNADLAIIDKRRPKAGISEVMNVIGDIKGKNCILVDDIVDSAGTICNAANVLMEKGAKSVDAFSSHGVFTGDAIARIENSALGEMVVTDSIADTEITADCPKIKRLSIAFLLGEAISKIHNGGSVSDLFEVPAVQKKG